MIRQANLYDVLKIYEIISQHSDTLVARSLAEIGENIDNFVVAILYGKVVGCAYFDSYSYRIAEVRSVAVLPEYRNRGLGKGLTRSCLKKALPGQQVFVVTSSPDYFKKVGGTFCLGEKYIMYLKKPTF